MRKPSAVTLHTALALTWLGMVIPTLLLWSQSVLWVAFMSLYANVAAHWAARQGAKAEHAAGAGE